MGLEILGIVNYMGCPSIFNKIIIKWHPNQLYPFDGYEES
jgi:hypothetical protein